jgi:hypothetical protein
MFGQRINYRDAIKKYNLNERTLMKYIQNYGLEELGDYGPRVAEEHSLHAALNLKRAFRLYLEYNEGWYQKFKVTDPFENILLCRWGKNAFDLFNFYPLKLVPEVITELVAIREQFGTEVRVERIQNEQIEKQKKNLLTEIPKGFVRGATIKVYCMDCRTEFDDKKCKKEEKDGKHGLDRKKYTVRFYLPGKKVPLRKWLTSRHSDEAVEETKRMLNALRETSYNSFDMSSVAGHAKKLIYLEDAIAVYIKFKETDEDQIIVIQKNSSDYIDSIKHAMSILQKQVLKLEYRNFPLPYLERTDLMKVIYENLRSETICKEDIGTRVARGKVVGDIKYSDVTINNYTSRWSSFVKWLNDKKHFSIQNPFKKRIPVEEEPKAISDEQFDKLISWMESKPKLPVHKRNNVSTFDLNWLRVCFLLQKRFDLRREDVVSLKWTDIGFDTYSDTWILRSVNHKATARKKTKPIYRYSTIETEDYKILQPLGFDTKVGLSDDYIILSSEEQYVRIAAPGRRKILSRVEIMRKITNGFTFLAKCLFGENFELTNRNVRKLKLTDNSVVFGEDAYKKSHKSKQVFHRYVDPRLKASKLGALNPNAYRKRKTA